MNTDFDKRRFIRKLTAVCAAVVMLCCGAGAAAESAIGVPYDISAVSPECGRIEITWSGVEGADGYELFYRSSESDNEEFKRIKAIEETEYVLEGAMPNTEYSFKVRAVKHTASETVLGEFSNTVSVTPAIVPPEQINAQIIDCGTVNITWNEAAGVKGYEVFAQTPKDKDFIRIGKTQETEFTGDMFAPNEPTSIKVRSYYNSKGNRAFSEFSQVIALTTVIDTPENVTAASFSNGVELSWDAVSGATAYRVLFCETRDGEYEKIANVTGTSFVNTAENAKNGFYKVQAYYMAKRAKEYYSEYSFSGESEAVSVAA